MTILRQAHVKSYTKIENKLAQNNNLTLRARGLMLYLLSLPDHWKVHLSHLAKVMKEGRRIIEKTVQELKEAGYIHHHKKGFKGGWEYFVFELAQTPEEFKKSLRTLPLFEEFENPNSSTGVQLEKTYSKNKKEPTEEREEREIAKAISLSEVENDAPTQQEYRSVEADQNARPLAEYLWNKIISLNPKAKKPNLASWAKACDRILRIDKRGYEETLSLLDWIYENDCFWSRTLQSPEGLRRNYDRLFLLANPPDTSASRYKINRSLALEAKALLSQDLRSAKIIGLTDSIIYKLGTEEALPFDMDCKNFKKELYRIFKLMD